MLLQVLVDSVKCLIQELVRKMNFVIFIHLETIVGAVLETMAGIASLPPFVEEDQVMIPKFKS
jgi:hypothetical protein